MQWEEGIEDSWSGVAEEVMSEIREWREQHPKATFREIEEAVDRLMAKHGRGSSRTLPWPVG